MGDATPRPSVIRVEGITKVYESENYDYPIQVQESITAVSSTIGYNITNFAATNLKGTNLPVPASSTQPPEHVHRTLPHALSRAANHAAQAVAASPGPEGGDKLAKALKAYGTGWDRIAAARLDQDDAISNNFLAPWQQTLNTSITLAVKARAAVQASRLELDAAKQTYGYFGRLCLPCFLLNLRVQAEDCRYL